MKRIALVILLCVALAALMLGCSSESSSTTPAQEEATTSRNCNALEPDNPYSPGSGHYAGFEWAEKNDPGSCGGNSNSFIEGCEEHQRQKAVYEACVSKR